MSMTAVARSIPGTLRQETVVDGRHRWGIMTAKLFEVRQMPVEPYAHWQALMQRTAEAVTVPKRQVAIGEWQPQENQCHLNATTYCEHETDCQPVRGWLYLSALTLFVAHSVVRGPDGSLFDITPWVDRVRQVDARYAGVWELPVFGAVASPTAVLIRPDGYVAWVSEGTDLGLHDALTTWFGARTLS